jgi:uncharacterized protein YdeI (YjbR/CyaY-like superfamily)
LKLKFEVINVLSINQFQSPMKDKKQSYVYAVDRHAWREWLKENHCSAREIWLVFYKKDSGKASVTYRESVEEAICFGWIDGVKKRVDDESYTHRFSPRKPKSKWSVINVQLAEKLIEAGLMMEAGMTAYQKREIYDDELIKLVKASEIELPVEIENALRSNDLAWKNYVNLAPGYRKQYAGWLIAARRPETRKRRVTEAIRLLEQNQKLGMK